MDAFTLPGFDLGAFVRATLAEDLGEGLPGGGRDVTSESVIPANARFAGVMDSREAIYATRMGGATNYRMGLWDAVMIKDNHVAVAGGVGPAVERAKAAGVARIICEVDRLDQIEPAIVAGATQILLDNMTPAMLAEAVTLVAGRAATEASGGVRLDTIAAIAASGVDYVSVGRLMQSAPAADIGLDFELV
ncbi:hypothetical protein BWI17_02245 [Betaproteobacteria bacterium GR16-43]|nr:hypothetical protein BWI17_02245 [Betaproteobacteria bacterium GR16-43]